jgi:sugar lactone lactonase YvrE
MSIRLFTVKSGILCLAAAVLLVSGASFTGEVRELLVSVSFVRQSFIPWYNRLRAGDGRSANEILLGQPMGIAEDNLGNIIISDRFRFIWKVDSENVAKIIAGTGQFGTSTTEVPALQSELGRPEGICVDKAGRVYFADSLNHVILRIENNGSLTRVAGTGRRGYGGDGGPAIRALLNKPYEVRLDSDENIYIADTGNHRIRKVTRNGIIQTFAGNGEPGYSGDAGPAGSAQLNHPYGIFVLPGNVLLIADSSNHVLRKVDQLGVITTLAGTGSPGYSGDHGPARSAMLNSPQAVFVDSTGLIYVGDEHNHAIRIIQADGTIDTIAGQGTPGFAEDNLLAAEAPLNDPENLIVRRRTGVVLISDSDNGRVLRITPDGMIQNFAGQPVIENGK